MRLTLCTAAALEEAGAPTGGAARIVRRSLLYKSNRALQLETLMRIYWIIIALGFPSRGGLAFLPSPPPFPPPQPSASAAAALSPSVGRTWPAAAAGSILVISPDATWFTVPASDARRPGLVMTAAGRPGQGRARSGRPARLQGPRGATDDRRARPARSAHYLSYGRYGCAATAVFSRPYTATHSRLCACVVLLPFTSSSSASADTASGLNARSVLAITGRTCLAFVIASVQQENNRVRPVVKIARDHASH